MSASREKKLRRELREAEANSDTVKKVKKAKKKTGRTAAQAQRLRSGLITALVIVLVAAFCLLIFVNSGFLQTHTAAATVGSHKLTPATMDYYYQDSYATIKSNYSSYGYWEYFVDTSKEVTDQIYGEDQTWSEAMVDSALTNAQQIYTLYDAATAEGYTLPEDQQTSLTSIPDTIASYAKDSGLHDGDEYLADYYGKGANVDSYVDYVTRQQIASGYASDKLASFSYTDEEMESYYQEHKQDFDLVTYRVFNVTTVDDDTAAAKSTADSMLAELDGTEKSFSDAALEYAPEDSKETYEDESYTLRSGASYSSISTDYADWLFGESRVAGEANVFATDSGYAVVMFVSRDDNHYQTVNVRHILANADADSNDEITDEEWDAAEEKINEILADWEASDMTEETFASMADEQSDDTGSVGNGGLYENVHKGQMVANFNDWCFDASRQVGDYGVVKTEYGYHLIYFSGFGDEYWKDSVDNTMRNEDYNAWFEEASASYEGKTNWFGMLFVNKTLEP